MYLLNSMKANRNVYTKQGVANCPCWRQLSTVNNVLLDLSVHVWHYFFSPFSYLSFFFFLLAFSNFLKFWFRRLQNYLYSKSARLDFDGITLPLSPFGKCEGLKTWCTSLGASSHFQWLRARPKWKDGKRQRPYL